MGKFLTDKIHGSGSITTFQISGSDMPSNTFAVSLKIKQQHRIAGMEKKFRMIRQLHSIGANSVHQDDNAFIRLSCNKPAMQSCTTGTGKFHRLNRQIGGWFSDFAIAWSNKNSSLVPGE